MMSTAKTTKPKKSGHGGARPNAGRKPGQGQFTEVLTARVSPQQAQTFASAGGAAWLRKQLDLARLQILARGLKRPTSPEQS